MARCVCVTAEKCEIVEKIGLFLRADASGLVLSLDWGIKRTQEWVRTFNKPFVGVNHMEVRSLRVCFPLRAHAMHLHRTTSH
jgi:hypothetical protein